MLPQPQDRLRPSPLGLTPTARCAGALRGSSLSPSDWGVIHASRITHPASRITHCSALPPSDGQGTGEGVAGYPEVHGGGHLPPANRVVPRLHGCSSPPHPAPPATSTSQSVLFLDNKRGWPPCLYPPYTLLIPLTPYPHTVHTLVQRRVWHGSITAEATVSHYWTTPVQTGGLRGKSLGAALSLKGQQN